ncbi:MAG: hypothetical protein HW375_1617 [Anaerolineales bacterium]|nr:hypothetical protein [Anaerolineales bacterium]
MPRQVERHTAVRAGQVLLCGGPHALRARPAVQQDDRRSMVVPDGPIGDFDSVQFEPVQSVLHRAGLYMTTSRVESGGPARAGTGGPPREVSGPGSFLPR